MDRKLEYENLTYFTISWYLHIYAWRKSEIFLQNSPSLPSFYNFPPISQYTLLNAEILKILVEKIWEPRQKSLKVRGSFYFKTDIWRMNKNSNVMSRSKIVAVRIFFTKGRFFQNFSDFTKNAEIWHFLAFWDNFSVYRAFPYVWITRILQLFQS